jgi:hypothetical protein
MRFSRDSHQRFFTAGYTPLLFQSLLLSHVKVYFFLSTYFCHYRWIGVERVSLLVLTDENTTHRFIPLSSSIHLLQSTVSHGEVSALKKFKQNTKSVRHFSPCDFCSLSDVLLMFLRDRQVSVGFSLRIRATVTENKRVNLFPCGVHVSVWSINCYSASIINSP